jgi:orotate phosphoribosyltransferase
MLARIGSTRRGAYESDHSSQDEPRCARPIVARGHLTGQFTLRSGATYLDKYAFESDPRLLREIAKALTALLPDQADAVAGLELGGIPLATVLSQVPRYSTSW